MEVQLHVRCALVVVLSLLVGLLVFAAFWVGICALIAVACGHTVLLKRYPPREDAIREGFGFASGYMRWVNFKNGLTVKVGAEGLHLGPNGLFRPWFWWGLPCVPWSEVEVLRPMGDGFKGALMGFKGRVQGPGLEFILYGEPARAVQARLVAAEAGPVSAVVPH